MRNLMKSSRCIGLPYEVAKPTPSESLGYERGRLAILMKNAGDLNTKSQLALMDMDMEEVQRRKAIYQEAAQIQARKDELKELVYDAYNAGFLPKLEWVQAETWINGLEASQVPSQIAYYTRLIESKQPSKAA